MVPEVRILSDEEVQTLHARALDILARVGIKYESRRALDLLAEHGQKVDYDSGIAWIKPDLVERCLKTTPRVITLGGRNPKHDMVLDGTRLRITTNGQGTFTQDHRTGERRQGLVKDLRDSTRVGHQLDVVDYIWPMVVPFDVPGPSRVLHEMYHTYAMTSKHVQHEIQLPEHVPFALEMLEILAGGRDELRRRPIYSVVSCTVSPLQHEPKMAELCIDLARAGIPIVIWPMPLTGATAPITVPGTCLMSLVEFLSGLVLFQTAAPGCPLIYPLGPEVLDMRSGMAVCGGPEIPLFNLVLGQMAKFYNVPALGVGLNSDAKLPGIQAAYESMQTGLAAALSGADLLVGIGVLDDNNTLSLTQMIIESEIARMVKRIREGVTINDRTLMAHLIEKAGPGQHFLGFKETLNGLKQGDVFFPRFSYRSTYDKYFEEGHDEIGTARAEVERLLALPDPDPLPPEVDRELQRILAAADKACAESAA
ncbi:MAG TPA: trimethylamine methyltransferase family protein [Candidatus Polarisedimenticolia bacterium]|nr:trimethylamine methyltransferase family protein [Candidatus Polarisedimenticolia bacterium]